MNRAEIKTVGTLVISHAAQHPGRMLLTLLSTVAAACIVVWVVSGYDSLTQKFDDFAEEYMGRYDAYLLPTSGDSPGGFGRGPRPQLSPELVLALGQDPAVASIDPIFESGAQIRRVGGSPNDSADAGNGSEQGGRAARGPRRRRERSTDASTEKTGGEARENRSSDSEPTPVASAAPGEGAPQSNAVRMMGGFDQLRMYDRAPALIGTNSQEPPHTLREGKWIDPRQPDKLEAVITHGSAEQLGVKTGDELIVSRGPDDSTTLKVIGIVEQPKRLPPPKFMVGLPPSRDAALRGGPTNAAVYVPTKLAETLTGQDAQVSYVGIALKPGNSMDDFRARWADRFATATPAAEIRTLDKVESEVDNSTTFEGVRSQAFSATGISLLASLFIIFTTLSMGVHERIRQFAVLRAVALTKLQVAMMIGLESLLLGLIGWGGGLLAGWGLLTVMNRLKDGAVEETPTLGFWCIVLSGLCALGGSLAAAIMPAWQATSVSPLEAMVPRSRIVSARLSWTTTAIGLLLIAINPLVVFFLPMEDKARYGVSAAIGCTAMAFGFVLLTPLTITFTERVLGPVLAWLLGLNHRLLSSQLTTNMWRTLGTTVALTLGLGLFVAMQTWGYSMLGPFTPGSWTPDVVIEFAPSGLPDSEIELVQHTAGLVAEQCLPLAVKQVKITEDLTGFKERASATRQDSCLLVGVDPDTAFGGEHPMFNFEYAAGTRDTALAKIKSGRYCLVPDHFQRDTGLGVGGKFSIVHPDHPDQTVEYEIAGVVSMPGWHWMTKMGFRRGRVAALMFSSFDQVRSDFETGPTKLFWANMQPSVTEDELKANLLPIAQRNFDPQAARAQARSTDAGQETMAARFRRGRRGPVQAAVNLRSAQSVRKQIRERASGIIWALSQLPLVTLIVTSLGVINTVLSSVRTRRWEMGVLRALGVTRFGLFRLIVAESLLVGIVACLLSLGFGAMAGYCGTGVTRYVNIRGGQITPLIIPWAQVLIGFGITLGLCFLAALWPAVRTGRTEPLQLLQAGRASM